MPNNVGDLALKLFQFGLEGQYGNGGVGSVYAGGTAVPANRRLTVAEGVGGDLELTFEGPTEARGSFAGVYQHIFHQKMAKGKVPAWVYPDDLYYYLKLCVSGTPTWTTLPNTPITLLAATAIAATMPALTTQPNATSDGGLSKLIQVTLSNASANTTAVTVTLNGTNIRGAPQSETLNFSAGTTTPSAQGGGTGALSCTLWSKKYYATLTSVTTSAQPTGDTLAISGINAFRYAYTSDMGVNTLYSATGEYFDGAIAWQLPGLVVSKATLDAEMGKSFKFDADWLAKDKIRLAASAASINPAAPTGTQGCLANLSDPGLSALPTQLARFYADPIGSTPGTTPINARLSNFKWTFDAKIQLGKTADGTPNVNMVSRGYYGEGLNASFSLLVGSGIPGSEDPAELGAYLNQQARVTRIAFPGVQLPCGVLTTSGNWDTALLDQNGKGGLYGLMIDIAGTYTKSGEKAILQRTGMDFTLASEVEPVQLLAPMIFTIVSRLNPNS
jgi:hypothetical protein